jgi:hypothetical protein
MKIASQFASIGALAVAASLALGGGALADTASTAGAKAHMRAACQADLAKLCPGVQPGGGRIMQCLKTHKDEISAPCKSAMAERISEKRAAKAGQSATPAPAPPAN